MDKKKKKKEISKKVIFTDEKHVNLRVIGGESTTGKASGNCKPNQKAFREHNKKLEYGLQGVRST